jgi:NDP-sugar pyrophosphorylase family protein
MVPVLNRPFLEHTIAYLRQFGVDFDFKHLGFTGSGEDHKFEFTRL